MDGPRDRMFIPNAGNMNMGYFFVFVLQRKYNFNV